MLACDGQVMCLSILTGAIRFPAGARTQNQVRCERTLLRRICNSRLRRQRRSFGFRDPWESASASVRKSAGASKEANVRNSTVLILEVAVCSRNTSDRGFLFERSYLAVVALASSVTNEKVKCLISIDIKVLSLRGKRDHCLKR